MAAVLIKASLSEEVTEVSLSLKITQVSLACETCDKVFSDASNLATHKKTHSGEEGGKGEEGTKSEEGSKPEI